MTSTVTRTKHTTTTMNHMIINTKCTTTIMDHTVISTKRTTINMNHTVITTKRTTISLWIMRHRRNTPVPCTRKSCRASRALVPSAA